MNRTYRRKKQQYVFGSVVAHIRRRFNPVFFDPVSSCSGRLSETWKVPSNGCDRRVLIGFERLESLQDAESQLDSSRRERLRFLAARTVPRDEGFAAVLPDLEQLAQIAGIRRNQVQYDLDPVPEFGVYSVRINIPVQGPYEAVTRFIRELEGFDRVFIIGFHRPECFSSGWTR